MQYTLNKQNGFTLVELAIVMIIIGLLIGGVLKGQQLIQNAKTTAVISEIKSYESAIHSFADTFDATPGDMSNARSRLPGCNNDNNCVNGNGNSLIEMRNGPTWLLDLLQRVNHSSFREPAQTWKHLALADLITGIEANADATDSDQLAWGATHPASAMRGGWEIIYIYSSVIPGFPDNRSGHVLRLTNEGIDAGTNLIGFQSGTSPMSPLEASNIDRKMDDGRPRTGSFQASIINSGTSSCTLRPLTTNQYDEQNRSKDCNIQYFID